MNEEEIADLKVSGLSELIKIYRYIKYCLWAHHGKQGEESLASTKDAQHEIFLYLMEVKNIVELNPGSKRLIYLLAKFKPTYIKRYQYRRSVEQVLLDGDGEPMEVGVSQEISGDVSYDLELRERLTQQHRTIREPKALNAKPLVATYVSGEEIVFPSLTSFAEAEGCSIYTALIWLKKDKFRSKAGKKDKYGHIKQIRYLNYTNPFAGSTVKITKALNEASWNKREDNLFNKRTKSCGDFQLEDENEYVKLFVHRKTKEGWLVKIGDPQGAEFYIQRNK